MFKPTFNEVINSYTPRLSSQQGDFSMLKKILIVTLAWLMKNTEGQTPDCLNLKQFTHNSLLIAKFEDIIENHWDIIGELHRNHSSEELRNSILFSGNEVLESIPLKQLTLNLLNMQSDDNILLLNSSIETELFEISENYSDNPVAIVDSQENLLIAEIRSRILGINPTFYDSKDYATSKPTANKVLAFDLITEDIRSRKLKKEELVDTANFLEWSLACLAKGDDNKAVICVDRYNLIKRKTISDLHQNKHLEAIILLNTHTLFGKCYIFILSNNNDHIRMVDASDCYTEKGRGKRSNKVLSAENVVEIMNRYETPDDAYSRLVPYPEMAWNNYKISPLHYLSPHDDLPNATSLGKVCEIKRGTMLSSKKLDEITSDKPTDYRFVSLKHLSEAGLETDLPSLQFIDERQQKYCLKSGQVIVTKMSPFRVSTVTIPDGQTYLASGNLYFLDVDTDKVSPIYLKMFLESGLGISQLDRFSKGIAVRTISIADLKQVQIPLISLSEQHKAAEEYQRLEAEANDLKTQLDSLISNQRNVIIDKLDSF